MSAPSRRTYKSIDYFDHDADIGIIGRGEQIEAAFICAAKAVFSIMTDISKIKPQQQIKISFEESDDELALVTWLNLLIGKAREYNLVFSHFELSREQSKWTGLAYGSKWRKKDLRGTEVKGATLTMLKVSQDHGWEARCVVDV